MKRYVALTSLWPSCSRRRQSLTDKELLHNFESRSGVVVQIDTMSAIGLNVCFEGFCLWKRCVCGSRNRTKSWITSVLAVTTAEYCILVCYFQSKPKAVRAWELTTGENLYRSLELGGLW